MRPFEQSAQAGINVLRQICELDRVPGAEMLTVARWCFITGTETAFYLSNMRSIAKWRKQWSAGKAIITACDKYRLAHPGEHVPDAVYYNEAKRDRKHDYTGTGGRGPGSIFGDLDEETRCQLIKEQQAAALQNRGDGHEEA